MNWRFWETKPEYLEEGEERPKKAKETLKQTAEKLVQRKMKKDPEGYGLVASEKLLNMTKEESKSLASQLKDHRELQKTLQELGGGGGESWLKQLGEGIASAVAPYLGEIVQKIAAKQPQLQQGRQPQLGQQPALQQAQPEATPEEAEAVREEPKADEVFIPELERLLELEPEQAAARLQQLNPEWIRFLGTQTHEDLFALLQKLPRNQENEQYIEELLSEKRRSWLKELINECRKLIKTG